MLHTATRAEKVSRGWVRDKVHEQQGPKASGDLEIIARNLASTHLLSVGWEAIGGFSAKNGIVLCPF